jgi:hypothetical protein
MSEPARHDDKWGEASPPTDQRQRRASGDSSEMSPIAARVDPERELPERATPAELGEWPVRSSAPARSRTADRAGYALGSATGRAQQLGVRLQDELHSRMDDLHNRVGDLRARFQLIRGRASENVQETAGHLKRDSRRNLKQMRSRAQQLAHDYPIHFVLGAAGSAFLIGFVLGWWRQND